MPECGTRILRVIHGRDARATIQPELTVPQNRFLAELSRIN